MTPNTVARQIELLERFVRGRRSLAELRSVPDHLGQWWEFVLDALPKLEALGFIIESHTPRSGDDPSTRAFLLTEKGFRCLAELEIYREVLKSTLATGLKDLRLELTAVTMSGLNGR